MAKTSALIVGIVALVAIIGLWMPSSQQAPDLKTPIMSPLVESPAPVNPKVVGCQESYDYRVELCNRRTHQESRDICLSNTNDLREECLRDAQ
ncbi:MAG TPA: hypothetical protein VJH22_04440 [Candidatus Nanoarchaeia archaeon]|nr:hypothetical protein [Candidatus Nanoarchaeia archaeon]